MSVKVVEIYRATKPLIKYPPCTEIGAFASAKSLQNKIRHARVREGCEVEINFDPKSWPLPSDNLFSCNFWLIAVYN